jgi:O-antigen/teichoic acid export membrane protein
MLLRHVGAYLLARGGPGIINLLGLALYTRLVAPTDYGHYTLAVAAVGLADAVLFQWLYIGLVRFFSAHEKEQQVFLSTVFTLFLYSAALSVLLCGAALLILRDPVSRGFVVVSAILLCVQGLFTLNLELLRVRLSPGRYGLLSLVRAVLVLVVSSLMAVMGLGAQGLVLGMVLGILLPTVWTVIHHRHGIAFLSLDKKLARKLLAYGLPLMATLSLGVVVSNSSRFFLGWLRDSEATGMYAAGYDLVDRTIGILMSVVNMAAFPLVVRCLEQEGETAGRRQLAHNAVVLLAVGFPAATGFVVLSPRIADVFLGSAFRLSAAAVIPWIAVAMLISCMRSFYLDMAFHLSGHTVRQIWVAVGAAVVNVGLNAWWIPTLGLMGAAYAAVAAYVVAALISFVLGRRLFALPFPVKEGAKVVLASAIMTGLVWPLLGLQGVGGLAAQIAGGVVAYGAFAFVLDIAGIRTGSGL